MFSPPSSPSSLPSPPFQTPLKPSSHSHRLQFLVPILFLIPLFYFFSHSQLTPLSLLPPPAQPPLLDNLTIAIKTYICSDETLSQLSTLLRTLRLHHPTLPILLANDGSVNLASHPLFKNDLFLTLIPLPPDSGISYGRNAMVNATNTDFIAILDDDHLYSPDGTELTRLMSAMQHFDIVGMRVHNLPGIPELEDEGIYIPRYVANITRFNRGRRAVELCVWNENAGPSVVGMETPIRVDVLHNAFMARVAVLKEAGGGWREELKVNEHMTFFLDMKDRGVKVGYLPSVYVWHRNRKFSQCYESVRRREGQFEEFLDYNDEFEWTDGCYKSMVEYVEGELEREKTMKRKSSL